MPLLSLMMQLYFATATRQHHHTPPTVQGHACLCTELNAVIALHPSSVELADLLLHGVGQHT